MSSHFFYNHIQKGIMKLFTKTILPNKVIIGIQVPCNQVLIIANEYIESFPTALSPKEFEELMLAKGAEPIHDAYFNVSFYLPVSALLSEAN